MATSKEPRSKSTFTLDNFADRSKGVLKKIEKRRESWESWEFVSIFRDKSGIAAGAFLKENKDILGLIIFGKGPTWNRVVVATTELAANGDTKAKRILNTLKALDPTSESKVSPPIHKEDEMSYRLVRYGDGQKLFRIKPLRYEQKPAKSRDMVIVAGAGAGGPTLGAELATFKRRFTKWVDASSAHPGVTKPKQLSQKDSLAYIFPGETSLMVFAPGIEDVHQVHLSGTTKGAAAFWFCVEGTLISLNPKMSETMVQEILRKLGKRKGTLLPKASAEIDDGKMSISYDRHDDHCLLQIWPSFGID